MSTSSKDEILRKIKEDPDYIFCDKFDNSLTKFLQKHPDGTEIANIAKYLLITEEEANQIYNSAIIKLRKALGVNAN